MSRRIINNGEWGNPNDNGSNLPKEENIPGKTSKMATSQDMERIMAEQERLEEQAKADQDGEH